MTASDRTAAIGADRAVVAARDESAANGKDVLKCISAVGAKFKHAPVEADVGIVGRRFKIEIVPECQLNTAAFKKRE